MKRAILFALITAFLLCGCKGTPDAVSSEKDTSGTVFVSSEVSSVEEVSSEAESSSETVSSEVPVSSAPTVSKPVSSVTVSKPKTSSSAPAKKPETSLGFEVTDPSNSRGLDTKKNGYGFGVAKDGKPHSISVNNQTRFDGMNNVSALALDRKSPDKRLYLTFDCGYEYQGLTGQILNVLKEKNVKAAFFCTLDYINDNPAFVQRMINEGHIVGNHSATHPSFPGLTRTQMANELYRVDAALKERFNYHSPYFRFPEGAYSECALELVTSVGFRSVFWSLAHADWDTSKQPGVQQTFDTVTSRLHPGAVILLHAVSSDNTKALGSIIDYAVKNGYSFKTLDDYPW